MFTFDILCLASVLAFYAYLLIHAHTRTHTHTHTHTHRFMFPQYFLSSHFLTEAQKEDLLQKALANRREKFKEIMNLVGDKLRKVC